MLSKPMFSYLITTYSLPKLTKISLGAIVDQSLMKKYVHKVHNEISNSVALCVKDLN